MQQNQIDDSAKKLEEEIIVEKRLGEEHEQGETWFEIPSFSRVDDVER